MLMRNLIGFKIKNLSLRTSNLRFYYDYSGKASHPNKIYPGPNNLKLLEVLLIGDGGVWYLGERIDLNCLHNYKDYKRIRYRMALVFFFEVAVCIACACCSQFVVQVKQNK